MKKLNLSIIIPTRDRTSKIINTLNFLENNSFFFKEIIIVDYSDIHRRLSEGSNLTVQTEKDGKYGRMLGWIYIGSQNVNKEMIQRGYAWEYDGGTKEKDLNTLKIKRGLITEV